MSAEQARSGVGSRDTRVGHTRAFTTDQVARMVIEAREQVVRRAHGHRQFSGLSRHDVEELFDSTTEIVIRDPARYTDADHVRASLWNGMHLRALDAFRRRKRRGFEADPTLLDLVSDDLGDHDERIARDQDLLVVRDFLAALTPREAEVWKLTQGEDLSVLQTSKRLEISRHAVGEHLDAATRKLEVFAALYDAGRWCGRRRVDIVRVLEGAQDEGTQRRALAHLDACAVCRRENAARVRETGRIAAGVLPMPAVLAGEHGRGLLERLLDLLPQIGGGGGRTEAAAGALFGGGFAGVAKVSAIVATTATVAVGAGTVVVERVQDERPKAKAAATTRSAGAAAAPAPVATVVRTPKRAAAASTSPARTARRRSSSSSTRADEDEDVFALGTVEPATGPATASSASSSAPAPAPEPATRESAGQEQFLP